MNYPLTTLMERFDEAPEEIQSMLMSQEVATDLAVIIDKYKLNYNQAVELGDQISFVVLGLTHQDNFTKNLQESLKIAPGETKKIADEVNEIVFKPVHDLLQKFPAAPYSTPSKDSSDEAPLPPSTSSVEKIQSKTQPETHPDHLLAGVVPPLEISAPAGSGNNAPSSPFSISPMPPAPPRPTMFSTMPKSATPPNPPSPRNPSSPQNEPPKPIRTLREDFNQAAQGVAAQGIAAQKLNTSFNMPTEKKQIDMNDKPQQDAIGKSADPYREPF